MPERFKRLAGIVGVALAAACGEVVVHEASEEQTPTDPPVSDDDGAEIDRSLPELGGDDDLSISLEVVATDEDPGGSRLSSEEARVEMFVTVTESAARSPVDDAEVRGGPPGALVALTYDVYSLASYGGAFRGYQPSWVVSAARGLAREARIQIEGPSYFSASGFLCPYTGRIDWAPANEPGVDARICATPREPLGPQVCVEVPDTGSFVLDEAVIQGMFPFGGAYRVAVGRTARSSVMQGQERSVAVYSVFELVMSPL